MSKLNPHSTTSSHAQPVWRLGFGMWRMAILVSVGLSSGSALAVRMSDITHTKHNLSINGPGTVKAQPLTHQSQICIFCHTPHGSTPGVAPLWNKMISSAVYTTYTSSSLDADAILKSDNPLATESEINLLKQPGGSSKLCLSCHDGTVAIGNVNVMWGYGTSDGGSWEMAIAGTQGGLEYGQYGKMPFGGTGAVSGVASAVNTGYTRYLGIDLTNDHPISVSYTQALSERNGELRSVDIYQKSGTGLDYGKIIGVHRSASDDPASAGYRPLAPLEPTGAGTGANKVGQVQCAACHDPHIRETDPAVGNQKFLRLNRFQEEPPTEKYNAFIDISCVACHDKNTIPTATSNTGTWAYSVHANPQVNTSPQTYKTAAAEQNEFPTTADGAATNLPMWKASCLNCHDTHTVQGARWLLREGTDSTSVPKAGGLSAIEETCYQCHSSSADSAVENGTADPVQDIKSDFTITAPGTHMPITLADQQGNLAFPMSPAAEAHSIGGNFSDTGLEVVDCSSSTNKCGADFVESRTKLGAGDGTGNNLANRHAECTDCHNPHRTVKFQNFQGAQGYFGDLSHTPDAAGTHAHVDDNVMKHTNVASGALRGTFGVEPTSYSSDDFNTGMPNFTTNSIKRGDPGLDILGVTDCAGSNKATCDNKSYVTREYQICLKCHSDYGYDDDNGADSSATHRPELGSTGLTTSAASGNSMLHYTNQAREFQAPADQQAALAPGTSGASAAYLTNNQRSWHPVMDKTGRTAGVRGSMDATAFNQPWSNDVGNQTMYCSDCHGANVSSTTSVIPDSVDPTRKTWGPHGSGNSFILKGGWNDATGPGQTGGLCFKCHDYASYAQGTGGGGKRTGFWMTDVNKDGHQRHVDLIGGGGSRCTMCHIAVPHGWKNKALLVNLNDVYLEAGLGAASEVRANTTARYDAAPYYLDAMLKVINFKPSGQWTAADCGSSGAAGNAESGVPWMKTSNENCATPP